MNKNEKLDQGAATAPQRVECEPKYTPGPWSVIICGERGTFHIPEAQRHEALHADDGVDGYTVSKANAHLIAAAPELLEALVEARNEIARARFGFGEAVRLGLDYHEFVKREWGGIDPKLAKMDSAIAKAEGRQ